MPSDQTISVDIISDVMCPWCYIGKRRLEAALGQVRDIKVETRWHPFQLDSTLPKGGKDRQTYLNDKFGGPERAAEIYSRIKEAGAEDGIPFAFDKIGKSPNTIDCHRLILWARADNLQDAVAERLFQLYFLEGADLTLPETLVKAARDVGMEADLVEHLLTTDSDLDKIEQYLARAHEIGVTGVPFFIIDGRFALAGAESPETLAAAIMHAAETQPSSAENV